MLTELGRWNDADGIKEDTKTLDLSNRTYMFTITEDGTSRQ